MEKSYNDELSDLLNEGREDMGRIVKEFNDDFEKMSEELFTF